MVVAAREISYYRLKWLEYVALTLDYHDLTGQWPPRVESYLTWLQRFVPEEFWEQVIPFPTVPASETSQTNANQPPDSSVTQEAASPAARQTVMPGFASPVAVKVEPGTVSHLPNIRYDQGVYFEAAKEKTKDLPLSAKARILYSFYSAWQTVHFNQKHGFVGISQELIAQSLRWSKRDVLTARKELIEAGLMDFGYADEVTERGNVIASGEQFERYRRDVVELSPEQGGGRYGIFSPHGLQRRTDKGRGGILLAKILQPQADMPAFEPYGERAAEPVKRYGQKQAEQGSTNFAPTDQKKPNQERLRQYLLPLGEDYNQERVEPEVGARPKEVEQGRTIASGKVESGGIRPSKVEPVSLQSRKRVEPKVEPFAAENNTSLKMGEQQLDKRGERQNQTVLYHDDMNHDDDEKEKLDLEKLTKNDKSNFKLPAKLAAQVQELAPDRQAIFYFAAYSAPINGICLNPYEVLRIVKEYEERDLAAVQVTYQQMLEALASEAGKNITKPLGLWHDRLIDGQDPRYETGKRVEVSTGSTKKAKKTASKPSFSRVQSYLGQGGATKNHSTTNGSDIGNTQETVNTNSQISELGATNQISQVIAPPAPTIVEREELTTGTNSHPLAMPEIQSAQEITTVAQACSPDELETMWQAVLDRFKMLGERELAQDLAGGFKLVDLERHGDGVKLIVETANSWQARLLTGIKTANLRLAASQALGQACEVIIRSP